MTVKDLIEELQRVDDKSKEVYMRIGGLPLVNVDAIELDYHLDIILVEKND